MIHEQQNPIFTESVKTNFFIRDSHIEHATSKCQMIHLKPLNVLTHVPCIKNLAFLGFHVPYFCESFRLGRSLVASIARMKVLPLLTLKMFSCACAPNSCKNGGIVPISKPSHDHKQEKLSTDQHPSYHLSWLIESMAHRRLYQLAESNPHTPQKQAAYRSHSNSVHLLITLTQEIHLAFNNDNSSKHLL